MTRTRLRVDSWIYRLRVSSHVEQLHISILRSDSCMIIVDIIDKAD